MPLGAILSLAGPILGILNSTGVIGGGGGGGGGNTYQPTGSGGADQGWQQALQQLQQLAGQQGGASGPVLQNAYAAMLGLPTGGLQAGANRAGEQYGNLSGFAQVLQNILTQQAGLSGQGQKDLMGAGSQLWQTSLDPQNALRDRMQQQVTDASRASTSMRGIGMGGEAAGIENQDVRNFLMDWQDRQLGRQATGLQGMTGAYGGAARQGDLTGQNLLSAFNMGSGGAQSALLSGQVPFQAGLTASQLPFDATSFYQKGMAGLMQPYGQIQSNVIPYLYAGQGAQGQAFNQGQQNLGNLTYGLGALAQSPYLQNIFKPAPQAGGGGGGGYDYGGNDPFYSP